MSKRDNALLHAKISQADLANKHRRPGPTFRVGDRVLLSTFHRRRDYQSRDASHAAKFMPCFDGPYTVQRAFPEKSCYTLNLPETDKTFPTFHVSLLRAFHDNDASRFPSRQLPRPDPWVTTDGVEEFVVDRIVDERRRGRGIQYLVCWKGWGLDDARWLPRRELEDCAALDLWLARHRSTVPPVPPGRPRHSAKRAMPPRTAPPPPPARPVITTRCGRVVVAPRHADA